MEKAIQTPSEVEYKTDEELKSALSKISDAIDIKKNPDFILTVSCIDKGMIQIGTHDMALGDQRCTNKDCVTCRGFDKVKGVVDRHLLSDKDKEIRDAAELARQISEDPQGYAEYLKEKEEKEND